MTTTAKVKWHFEADYLQACNCDFGCPCEFQAPPTQGFCEGTGAWKIQTGKYGDVDLSGLGLAFAARWPKALHEGNGTGIIFVDERANAQQRDALLQIASGAAGGLPFEIIVTTFSKVLDPQFVRFDFQFNGKKSRVSVGQAIAIATDSIKNPVTGEAEGVRIVHDTGFVFKEAECVAATECRSSVDGIKFSWPGKAGFVSRVHYGN